MLAVLTAEQGELQAYFPDERPELERLAALFNRVLNHTSSIMRELDSLLLNGDDDGTGECKSYANIKKQIVMKAKATSVSDKQFNILMHCVKERSSSQSSSVISEPRPSAEELVRCCLMKKYSISPQAALELVGIITSIGKLVK
jgi:hypothetical protein